MARATTSTARRAALAVRVRPLVHDVRARAACASTGPPCPTDGGELAISVDVANIGERAGDEVVQLYVRDEEASVTRPVHELRGFRRVTLAPGERRTVTFRLAAEQFCYTGADLRRVVEPGVITLSVGTSSADLPLSPTIELIGPVVEVVDRHHYLTETTVG